MEWPIRPEHEDGFIPVHKSGRSLHRKDFPEVRFEDRFHRFKLLVAQDLTLRFPVGRNDHTIQIQTGRVFCRYDCLGVVGDVVENESDHLRQVNLVLPLLVGESTTTGNVTLLVNSTLV
jgi:hypothetical protein